MEFMLIKNKIICLFTFYFVLFYLYGNDLFQEVRILQKRYLLIWNVLILPFKPARLLIFYIILFIMGKE